MTADQLSQLVEWAQVFGPALLAFAGFVNSLFLAAIGAAGRYAWKKHTERQARVEDALKALAAAVDGHADEAERIDEAVKALRAEVGLTAHALRTEVSAVSAASDRTTREVAAAGGVMQMQQAELGKVNAALALVTGKLEAVFRFMDAPRRPSDAKDG